MSLRILYSVPEDYPELWEKWTRKFRGRGSVKRVKSLRIVGKILVAIYVVAYLMLCWVTLLSKPGAAIGFIASSAVCFLLVSLYRRWRNEPRPYQVFDMKPLVPKKDLSVGKSLPSRHTFCAFTIATVVAIIFRSFGGAVFLVFAAMLAWIRVIQGVHFPRDVVLGAILGIFAGLLCVGALLVGVS